MAPKSRFFQAGFSVVFAVALIVTASPARAEPVILSCQVDRPSMSLTLRIDYTTGLVERLGGDGTAFRVATATVGPNAIIWSSNRPSSILTGDGVTHQTTEHWEGRIDRLSGTGWSQWRQGTGPVEEDLTFTCRQVTKPKF